MLGDEGKVAALVSEPSQVYRGVRTPGRKVGSYIITVQLHHQNILLRAHFRPSVRATARPTSHMDVLRKHACMRWICFAHIHKKNQICAYTQTYIYIYIYMYNYIYIYICVYIYIYRHMYVYMCLYVYMYMYICVYVYMYICTHKYQ